MLVLNNACEKPKEDDPPHPIYHTFEGFIGANDNSTIVTADNNLLICGSTGSDILLTKISKGGDLIWRSEIESQHLEYVNAVAEGGNGDIFLCGITSRNHAFTKRDVLLIKANSMGDTVWTKSFGSKEDDFGTQIINTMDGNLLICGSTYGDTLTSYADIYMIKVDTDGDTLWTRSYPDPDQEAPYHLMQLSNKEYLVTGTDDNDNPPKSLYLLKLDEFGNKLWDQKIGETDVWTWGYCSIELDDGNLLTCGSYNATGYTQLLLLKTDNWGNVIWENDYGNNSLSEKGLSMKLNLDNTVTITGTVYDVNTMTGDIILLSVDQDGTLAWYKSFGGSESDWGINLIKDDNDDNIITGQTWSYGSNASDGNIYMTRTGSDGNFK